MGDFPDFDTEYKWAAIPKEVWAEADKWLQSGGREGRRLADALTRHNDRQRRAQEQADGANSANAEASTGSARGNGKPTTFFSREDVSRMSVEEIQQHRKAIAESEKHWK